MSHYVKCVYCQQRFDRDKEECVSVGGRRYGHVECHNKDMAQKTQDEIDQYNLEDYIRKLFKTNTINVKIKRQIEDFREKYNYSFSGILKTLIYWYDIKKNSLEKANGGIGIVPYVYDQAREYYYRLYLAQYANELEDIQEYKITVKEVEIASPRVHIDQPKLFNL